MRPLKTFEEFLASGTVRKRTPDLRRSLSLSNESESRKLFLGELGEKIGLSERNANYFIEVAYDVLIVLIRARMLIDGFDASGKGAHEAEVSYLRKLEFQEPDVRFMNNLRYFRNGIKYYGKSFDKEHAEKVLEFLGKMYPKLKKMLR